MTKQNDKVMEVVQQLSQEIKELQNKVFSLKSVQSIVSQTSFDQLIELGLRFFAGSVGNPK